MAIPQWQKDMRESIQILKTLEAEPWSVSRAAGTSGAVVAGASGSGSRLAGEVGDSDDGESESVVVSKGKKKQRRRKSHLTTKKNSRNHRRASSGHSGDAVKDVDEEREKHGRRRSKRVTAKPKSRSHRSASSVEAVEVEVREKQRPQRKMKRLNAKPKTKSSKELCKNCFKNLSVKSFPYHLNKSHFHLQDRLNGIIGKSAPTKSTTKLTIQNRK